MNTPTLTHPGADVPSLLAHRQTLRTCHQLGVCLHPTLSCSGRCQMAAMQPMAAPRPLPTLPQLATLAPGAMQGPYRARTRAMQYKRAAFWMVLVGAEALLIWAAAAWLL